MTKADLGYKLSTSIAAMMLSVIAAQNASAQNVFGANRNNHNHNPGNHNPGSQSSGAVDPGVRGGTPGAGGMIDGLTAAQQAYFTAAQAVFR